MPVTILILVVRLAAQGFTSENISFVIVNTHLRRDVRHVVVHRRIGVVRDIVIVIMDIFTLDK